MPQLRTNVTTGQFPVGRECECARCGIRFIDLAAFDDHLPAEDDQPLICPLRVVSAEPIPAGQSAALSKERPSVTVSASVDRGGLDEKSDALTSTFAPAKRHEAARNRHGARAALTNKAQGRCKKGLHRKQGPGSCLRCQADRQRDYRRRLVQ